MFLYFCTGGAHLLDERGVLRRLRQIVERGLADVDAGLDRERHSGLQRRGARADVVHVHADPVRDAVGRPDLELRAGRFRDEPELDEAGPEDVVARRLNVAGAVARFRRRDARFLRREHHLVDVPFLGSERPLIG